MSLLSTTTPVLLCSFASSSPNDSTASIAPSYINVASASYSTTSFGTSNIFLNGTIGNTLNNGPYLTYRLTVSAVPGFTVSIWIQPTLFTPTGAANYQQYLSLTDGLTNTNASYLWWGCDQGINTSFHLYGHIPNAPVMTIPNGPNYTITANTWYHLVISYTGLQITAYINGTLYTTLSTTVPFNPIWLTIGAYNSGLYAVNVLSGGFSPTYYTDIRVYSMPLIASQIAALYTANTSPTYTIPGMNTTQLSLSASPPAANNLLLTTASPVIRTLNTISTILTITGKNVTSVVVNPYNNYIYYYYGGTNAIFVATTSGVYVRYILIAYTIQQFGGAIMINPVTGIVYVPYINASVYGIATIAPDTYRVTYNPLTNTPNIAINTNRGSVYSNGSLYIGCGTVVARINTATWVVSTYVTYTVGAAVQGVTAYGSNIYIMRVSDKIYVNTSTTGVVSVSDYWGMTTDGYYLYMGGAGTLGIFKTVIGTWGTPESMITAGTPNPPALITGMYYYNNKLYIAGYNNNAILLLS